MKKVVLEVPPEIIAQTKDMNCYQRKSVLVENGLIADHLLYGYGVYGGARIQDESHVWIEVGDSCD